MKYNYDDIDRTDGRNGDMNDVYLNCYMSRNLKLKKK